MAEISSVDKAQGNKRCVFCLRCAPEVKISSEHVLRAALMKLMPGLERRTIKEGTYVCQRTREVRSASLDIPVSPFEWTVNDVCKPCNEGWLEKEVEISAELLLAELIRGTPCAITAENSKSLALWAAKTAAMRALMEKGKLVIPPEHYQHIMKSLEPPPNTHVWLASLREQIVPFTRYSWFDTFENGGAASPYGIHWTTIAIGCMALFIGGATVPGELEFFLPRVDALRNAGVTQLWPPPDAGFDIKKWNIGRMQLVRFSELVESEKSLREISRKIRWYDSTRA